MRSRPTTLFFHFASSFIFKASAFFQIYFRFRNIFGSSPALDKALACPWYISSIFISVFLFVIEVIFCEPVKGATWDLIECFIHVSTSFIKIIKFFIWFSMDLVFQLFVRVPEKFKIEVREIFWCSFQYVILFKYWWAFVWHPNFAREIASMHCLQFFYPTF